MNIKCMWYWNPRFIFSLDLRPLNCHLDVLKFVDDVNGFELVDVYVENKIDNLDVVYEEELGNVYNKEVHINGICDPNSDDDEVEVESDNVNDEVQKGIQKGSDVDDEVQVRSDNVYVEVQVGSDDKNEYGDDVADYVGSDVGIDNFSDSEYECIEDSVELDWLQSSPVVKR
ncbi:hypothetical protein KIW84_025273 [Lathyrus oleraceus]|uniref:Uncharacterized protein n=1 Tax=Pisum sativum TaxID=3888 RepID=A0A9D4YNJ6_PEA|nr:hypothetical protein KIW84_025273 [Pisum sativum]